MSARAEIERHQLSLDSRRPQYQKRSTSLSALRYTAGADVEMEDEPIVVETSQFQPSRRQKSVSVCVASLPSSSAPPRTIEQYEQQAVRNGLPQALSAYELHHVRRVVTRRTGCPHCPHRKFSMNRRRCTFTSQDQSLHTLTCVRRRSGPALTSGTVASTSSLLGLLESLQSYRFWSLSHYR